MKKVLLIFLIFIHTASFAQHEPLRELELGLDLHSKRGTYELPLAFDLMLRHRRIELNAGVDMYGEVNLHKIIENDENTVYGYHAGISYYFFNRKNRYYIKFEYTYVRAQRIAQGNGSWKYNVDVSKLEEYLFPHKEINKLWAFTPGTNWRLFSNCYLNLAVGVGILESNIKTPIYFPDAHRPHSDEGTSQQLRGVVQLGINTTYPSGNFEPTLHY